jgi:hypothetical protein
VADKDITVGFPVAGVSAATEYGGQPPGTAVAAQNVRATDALATRLRGGSRPGLTRYVDAPVDGTVGHEVQHLAAIVDPTVDALLTSFEAYDPPGGDNPGVEDPSDGTRNPGRLVRPGGSGVQPNRNAPQRRQAQHRQSKGHAFAFTFGTTGASRADVLAFDQPVRRKSLVVAVLGTINVNNIAGQTQHAVADSLGLQWHESPGGYEGPYPAVGNPDYDGAARLFWAYADFVPDTQPLTVTVTTTAVVGGGSPTAPSCPPLALALLEYTGVKFFTGGSTAVLDASAVAHGGPAVSGSALFAFDAGPVTPTTNNGLVLGAFVSVPGLNGAAPVAATPAAAPPFAVRVNVNSKALVVVEATAGLAGAAVTPGCTVDFSALAPVASTVWAFLAASFVRVD